MKTTAACAALMAALLFCAPLPVPAAPQDGFQAPSPTSTTALAPCCKAAADALVELETTEAISSKDRKPGDFFGIQLHAPLLVDGAVLLPAGTRGVGQVVHAERARGGGKPGELILAARYLQVDARQVRLHGMKLSAVGNDHSQAALATAMAVGVFGQFVHGGEIELPAGTHAQAKLVEAYTTPTPVAASAADTKLAAGMATGPTPEVQPTVPPKE